jgi:hypothetical protein
MKFIDKSTLQVGDWVKATSKEGELILGYIDSLGEAQDTVKVKIIESDHGAVIGKALKMFKKNVEKLPVSTSLLEEQVVNLIDLALLTNDKEWFLELSQKLSEIRTLKNNEEKNSNDNERVITRA